MAKVKRRRRLLKRPDRFLVGYRGKRQVVYGRDRDDPKRPYGYVEFVSPMTWTEAVNYLTKWFEPRHDEPCIFELVEVASKPKETGVP